MQVSVSKPKPAIKVGCTPTRRTDRSAKTMPTIASERDTDIIFVIGVIGLELFTIYAAVLTAQVLT